MSHKKSALIIFGVIFIVIDQAIKLFCIQYFPKIVSYNQGIFFGSIDDSLLLILFLVLGFFVLGYLFIKSPTRTLLPLTLITSGAISNIIDRFVHVGVVDYINISFWSNFNIADIFIVIGAIWYLYIVFSTKNPKSRSQV